VRLHRKHLPARFRDLVDVRRFGPGERIVVPPFSREMFEGTRRWIETSNIFEDAWPARRPYEESTRRAVT
jgi:NitT/TauT family transport system substrate-binding protein